MALGSIRRLTTGALDAGLHHGSSARTVSPATARCPGSTSTSEPCGQVGVQPRAEPDQAVGVADRHLVAGLDVADDAARHQPRDLHGDHLGALGGADQTLLRSLSSLAAARSAEPNRPGPVHDGDHLTADRGALHVRVEDRQEDADPRQRPSGRPSSAGGTASSMRQISPSAGATTTPGRVGGTRGGCRKNAALAAAAEPGRRGAATDAGGPPRRRRGWRRRTAGRRGASGESWYRTSATSRAGPDLRSGRLAIVCDSTGGYPATTGPTPARPIPRRISVTSSAISSRQLADASQRR